MPIPVIIPDYLETGAVAQFLAADDENNFVKNPGGKLDPKDSALINFVRTAIAWAYAIDPTNENLIDAVFYLKALIGKYWSQAYAIIGSGTGIIISPSGNQALNFIREQTTVAISGGTLNEGDTVWVLSYSNVLGGSVEVLIGESVMPRNDSTTQSYVLTIQASTFTITFSQQLNAGDIVTVTGVQTI